jgi:hypothetical protein
MPATGIAGQALPGLIQPSRRKVRVGPASISLHCPNFNELYCGALNERKEMGLTHFCMHHADIEAPPFFIDSLVDEAEAVGADILSCVVAIKDERGLTSTGYMSPSGTIVRLTLTEIHEKLPPTFSAADLGAVGAPKGSWLAVNTGLWVCRFDQPWNEPPTFPGFQTFDQIHLHDDGLYRKHNMPEDWAYSQWAAKQRLRVFATSRLNVAHHGAWRWASDRPTGTNAADVHDDERHRNRFNGKAAAGV